MKKCFSMFFESLSFVANHVSSVQIQSKTFNTFQRRRAFEGLQNKFVIGHSKHSLSLSPSLSLLFHRSPSFDGEVHGRMNVTGVRSVGEKFFQGHVFRSTTNEMLRREFHQRFAVLEGDLHLIEIEQSSQLFFQLISIENSFVHRNVSNLKARDFFVEVPSRLTRMVFSGSFEDNSRSIACRSIGSRM